MSRHHLDARNRCSSLDSDILIRGFQMKKAHSAGLVNSRKFAEYIGVMKMPAAACIFLIFSVSALAQEPNSSRGQGYLLFAAGGGNVGAAPNIHIAAGGEAFVYRGLGIGMEVGPIS